MDIQSTLFQDLTTIKQVTRIIVAVVGGTVLAVGLVPQRHSLNPN